MNMQLRNSMLVMDRTGHTTVTWNPAIPVEVEVAKASFDKLIKEGYNAFRVDEANVGSKGERLTTFDPKVGKIMMVPHLVGG